MGTTEGYVQNNLMPMLNGDFKHKQQAGAKTKNATWKVCYFNLFLREEQDSHLPLEFGWS